MLLISTLVALMVLAALVVVVFSLARQIGVLHERTAPAGALLERAQRHAPVAGDVLEPTVVQLLGPRRVLLFIATRCAICATLHDTFTDWMYHVYGEPAGREAEYPVIWVIGGGVEGAPDYIATHHLPAGLVLVNPNLALALQVIETPTLVIVDEAGRLVQREKINDARHLRRLLDAVSDVVVT